MLMVEMEVMQFLETSMLILELDDDDNIQQGEHDEHDEQVVLLGLQTHFEQDEQQGLVLLDLLQQVVEVAEVLDFIK